MALASSFVVGHAQVDGRRYVVERHIDSAGKTHVVEYLADDGTDYTAVMLARGVGLEAALKDADVHDCIATDRATSPYLTKTELGAFVRELYRTAEAETLVKIARWIRRRIAAGDFTETQVRNAFGLAQTQWNTLKAKMQTLDESLATVETATGE